MNCPICNAWSSVTDSRDKGNYMQRKRQCANEHMFTTEEHVVPSKRHGGAHVNRATKGDINAKPVPI